LTVDRSRDIIMSFAGVERKFFEKGIRRDRKPVPIHPKWWIDVNFFVSSVFILEITKPGIYFRFSKSIGGPTSLKGCSQIKISSIYPRQGEYSAGQVWPLTHRVNDLLE
jgi:hypothetical protein